MDTNTNIISAIANETAGENLIHTENGALGYETSRDALVDFFYKVGSMRNLGADAKRKAFAKCLADNDELAMRFLFFLRDARGGLGERLTFRDIIVDLPASTIVRIIPLIPVYGRWDDLFVLLDKRDPEVDDAVFRLIRKTWDADLVALARGEHVSLLAKWMPSIRKVSPAKVRLAKRLARECIHEDERRYRKHLSALRAALRVVERDMTLDRWSKIDYSSVPSLAGLRYREAFLRHDGARRRQYLSALAEGKTKINASVLYPYDIVGKYSHGGVDVALEEAWKALPEPSGMLSKAIVVRDGSGSMCSYVGGSVSALSVATSLAILAAEKLEGVFHDKFITFSDRPKLVDLSGCKNLREKINRAYEEADIANTDIEKTFKLILNAAVNHGLKQEDIPTVIVISDMEFDAACYDTGKALFEQIADEWRQHGLELPKLVFWNVNSRSGAIPARENENGVLLVSGFSQSIFDMLSENGGMREILVKKLMNKRYDPVSAALV